jgi:hypothetical protein
MRRDLTLGLLLLPALTLAVAPAAEAQGGAAIVFVSRRPPREIPGNIRSWATANRVNAVAEDTSTQVWRVQFMAFLSRAAERQRGERDFLSRAGRAPGGTCSPSRPWR